MRGRNSTTAYKVKTNQWKISLLIFIVCKHSRKWIVIDKLQTNSDLTLGQAVQQARQSENVKKKTRSIPIARGSSKRGKAHSFGIVET